MKTINFYPVLPGLGTASDIFDRADPFELLDRVFETEPFLSGVRKTPAADVRELDDRYVIEVELPGLSEKDVKLELKDGRLSLSTAEKKEEEGKVGRWLRRERREYRFSRSFVLPEDVDGGKAEARFKDGLLSIELPKKPEAAPIMVPVRSA